jgi:retron-type reverse transcriptase
VRKGLKKCLKAGAIDVRFPEKNEDETSMGTPQGGVISQLLANIALNGIEDICPSVRYADDMVFFIREEQNPERILQTVSRFLAERGMKISKEKTKITDPKDGFDFLGWNMRVQKGNGKFKTSPSKKNVKKFIEKVDEIRLDSKLSAKVKVSKLTPSQRVAELPQVHRWKGSNKDNVVCRSCTVQEIYEK